MMVLPESTSAEAFDQYVSGRLIAASNGWKDLLVRIYSESRVRESTIVPGVAEPFIVRVLSGAAVVEERELGGPWVKTRVEAGDFFLTASQSSSQPAVCARRRPSSGCSLGTKLHGANEIFRNTREDFQGLSYGKLPS
jgi:hypothetical protein